MKRTLPALVAILATPAITEGSRELDAHEHGVGTLNIAIDGETLAMEFEAPGADIVGFEYEAESAEDRAAIDAAVAVLAKPLDLFVLPADAACSVTRASAELDSEDDHDHEDHDDAEAHDEHDHDEHDHDDHADAKEHEDHDEHDEHDHDDHADAEKHDDHDEHDHDDHAEAEENHTEFHAEYVLSCGNPEALSGIEFAYFETFENALELEVQVVTASGAQAFEVTRDAPSLDLRGMF